MPARKRKKANKKKNKKADGAEWRSRYRKVGAPGSLAGAAKLRTALSGASRPSRRALNEALAAEESYTLHRPVRYRFPRRQTIVSGPGDQLQCDLVDCSGYKADNDGVRYLFCCIDVFTKRAWVRPLVTKRGAETAAAMATILDSMEAPPLAVQSDKGSEMLAAPFQRLLKSRAVHFFTSENDDVKCSVVERFQRTLQTMIHRHMTAARTRRFVDVLPGLVDSYNATYHRAIGMAPRDVNWSNAEAVWDRLYSRVGRERWAPPPGRQGPLAVGDKVRLSKTRRQFAKGYTGHWSREVFTVDRVLDTTPLTYVVADASGEAIKGSFYGPELQRVTPPDYFDVEAVLDTRRRRGRTEYLVKWAGYPASFNSWETDVVRL